MLQELFPIHEYQVSKYSYSRIELFRQCKLRYKLKYIDSKLNNDQKDSFYLSLGRSTHRILKEYFNPSNNIKPDVDFLFEKHWISSGFQNHSEENQWKKRTKNRILDFINNDNAIDKVLEVESNFEKQSDRYLLTTIIDRINKLDTNYCEIIEYKFGEINSDSLDVSYQIQWFFHYIASSQEIFHRYEREIAYIEYCFIDSGEKFRVYPTPILVKNTLDYLISLLHEIENEIEFKPKINKFCSDCRFDMICPLIRKGKF